MRRHVQVKVVHGWHFLSWVWARDGDFTGKARSKIANIKRAKGVFELRNDVIGSTGLSYQGIMKYMIYRKLTSCASAATMYSNA